MLSRVRNSFQSAGHTVVADVTALSLTARQSRERVWAIGRLLITVTVIFGTLLLLQDNPVYTRYLQLTGFALAYGVMALVLLLRGKVLHAFIIGFVLDNAVILYGWWDFVRSNADALSTNDLYLIIIPVLIVGIARLGWMLGSLYSAFYLAWMVWVAFHYYSPASYDVRQMPVRVLLIAITLGLVIRLMVVLDQERRLEVARLRKLDELDRVKNDLLRSAAHSFRSPLTSLKVASGILSASDPRMTAAQQAATIRLLERSVARLERIVNKSLQYASLGDGGGMRREQTDVNALVQQVASQFTEEVSAKRQRVIINFHAPVPPISIDPTAMEEVLVCLVDNAVKYAPIGGNISIGIRQQDSLLEAEVADNGPGIPSENQEFLFHPYYRGPQSDRVGPGDSGLGLAMVKQLVEMHEGSVKLISKAGQGTRVLVKLPYQRQDLNGRH